MDSADITKKPSYLGLLNAISLAESAAAVYLEAWANVTPNEDLARTLRLVAARERSHSEVFCRRIAELGYALRRKSDPQAARRLAKLADPDVSDLQKIGPECEEEADPFGEIRRRMREDEFDPLTLSLINWYIAEEKDSAKRLREAYARVRESATDGAKKSGPANIVAEGPSADAQALMACVTAGFAKLEKSLEKFARATT
jgi:rubrerythrin